MVQENPNLQFPCTFEELFEEYNPSGYVEEQKDGVLVADGKGGTLNFLKVSKGIVPFSDGGTDLSSEVQHVGEYSVYFKGKRISFNKETGELLKDGDNYICYVEGDDNSMGYRDPIDLNGQRLVKIRALNNESFDDIGYYLEIGGKKVTFKDDGEELSFPIEKVSRSDKTVLVGNIWISYNEQNGELLKRNGSYLFLHSSKLVKTYHRDGDKIMRGSIMIIDGEYKDFTLDGRVVSPFVSGVNSNNNTLSGVFGDDDKKVTYRYDPQTLQLISKPISEDEKESLTGLRVTLDGVDVSTEITSIDNKKGIGVYKGVKVYVKIQYEIVTILTTEGFIVCPVKEIALTDDSIVLLKANDNKDFSNRQEYRLHKNGIYTIFTLDGKNVCTQIVVRNTDFPILTMDSTIYFYDSTCELVAKSDDGLYYVEDVLGRYKVYRVEEVIEEKGYRLKTPNGPKPITLLGEVVECDFDVGERITKFRDLNFHFDSNGEAIVLEKSGKRFLKGKDEYYYLNGDNFLRITNPTLSEDLDKMYQEYLDPAVQEVIDAGVSSADDVVLKLE